MDVNPSTAVTKPKKQKLKPARKQVKPGEVEKKEVPQTGKEYNIWYNKWAGGDREDSYSNKFKSQTRCNIKRDSGLTRANTTGMRYTCLFFARGCCPYGWECEYLHALPQPDVALPDSSKDCFAREKFADYRDDMGGVGSFNRQNRTLYVGRIKEVGNGQDTEEVVYRHFKEFGLIEKEPERCTGHAVKVLQYRSVAFVTFVHEIHAQFAKEAMSCQSLDGDEILNVRWATEDPNPVSKATEKRRLEEAGQEAIKGRIDPRIIDAVRSIRALEDGDTLNDDGHLLEDIQDEEPQLKRPRIEPPPMPSTLSASEPPKAAGLLSADTLESLKYFSQIRQKGPAQSKVTTDTSNSAGLGLAGYGSDDDD